MVPRLTVTFPRHHPPSILQQSYVRPQHPRPTLSPQEKKAHYRAIQSTLDHSRTVSRGSGCTAQRPLQSTTRLPARRVGQARHPAPKTSTPKLSSSDRIFLPGVCRSCLQLRHPTPLRQRELHSRPPAQQRPPCLPLLPQPPASLRHRPLTSCPTSTGSLSVCSRRPPSRQPQHLRPHNPPQMARSRSSTWPRPPTKCA